MEHVSLHDLTAAYALDALDQAETRSYEEHLAGCDTCQAELAQLSATAASLAYAAEPVVPPPALRGRILDAARAERPNVVPLRPRWRPQLAAAVAAAAAAAVVALTVWNISLHNELGSRQALQSVRLNGAAGSVVVGNGDAELIVAHLPVAPAGKTYEAWVIQGKAARPAGVFTGGDATTVVHLSRPVPRGSIVAVTVERRGGVAKPTRAPFITSQPV
jgi:anti-sigma factor RsiW